MQIVEWIASAIVLYLLFAFKQARVIAFYLIGAVVVCGAIFWKWQD